MSNMEDSSTNKREAFSAVEEAYYQDRKGKRKRGSFSAVEEAYYQDLKKKKKALRRTTTAPFNLEHLLSVKINRGS